MKFLLCAIAGLDTPAQLLGVDKDALKEKLVRYAMIHECVVERWRTGNER